MKIKLDRLVPNVNWQTRHKLDTENVERIYQAMKKGEVLPKILVRRMPDGRFEIFDGFHRYEAAKHVGLGTLDAELFKGTEHEALTEGITRNKNHGLQLLREDLKKAARMLHIPGDHNGGGKKGDVVIGSYSWLAKFLGVSTSTVTTWCNPEMGKRDRNRSREARRAATILKEVGEEGLKERVLERFGAEALDKTYEPSVKWSMQHKAGSPGVPMLMISDVHYGEKVNPEEVFGSNDFSRKICEARLKHTFETSVGLLKTKLANSDFPGIVLILGGDMISGGIHEEIEIADEVPPVVQSYEIAKLLADGVAFLADEFPRVDVYCVAGNHGRTTRKPRTKFYAHNNLDWLAYRMLADSMAGYENVTINAPNSRDMTFTVAGRRYRLTHGDQFKTGDAVIGPLGGIIRGDVRKRVVASLMPGQHEAYDTMLCGHFHQLMMLPRVIVNGSVKGYDEYAMSMNFPWEPPQQALWTVHPTHGQTWYMPVLCDEAYLAHHVLQETVGA